MPYHTLQIALGTAGLLLIPAVLRWPWGLGDFIIMGALIFTTGVLVDLVMHKISPQYRLIAATVVLLTAVLIWLELAVGLVEQLLSGTLI